MPRQLATDAELKTLLERGWAVRSKVLERKIAFGAYPEAVSFVVRIAFAAERRDHHPEIALSHGSVIVGWTTHDLGGISDLDLEMAQLTDRIKNESEGGGGTT